MPCGDLGGMLIACYQIVMQDKGVIRFYFRVLFSIVIKLIP